MTYSVCEDFDSLYEQCFWQSDCNPAFVVLCQEQFVALQFTVNGIFRRISIIVIAACYGSRSS